MNKSKLTISIEQAQLLALSHQGLIEGVIKNKNSSPLNFIEHLSYVQIDTLAVVARAHHHTLWSRMPNYKENALNELVEKKYVFEYWSHAASYLPMKDYRFSLPRKLAYAKGKSHWFEQDKKMKKHVLERIKAEGPLQSKDFEYKRNNPGNWYEWKPAKRALEQLFMEGKLMVANRQGFQKMYDLAERVLPSNINTQLPSENEMAEYLIKSAIQAHGIVTENEITYLRSEHKPSVKRQLKELCENGNIVEIYMEALEKPCYTSQSALNALSKLNVNTPNIHLLSPFDNVIIQRKRVKQLFNFDYMIECYLPEHKRKYGYFVLPVLYDNKFVARFDAKADRAAKTFYVKSLFFEKGFKPTEAFNILLVQKLNAFSAYNNCKQIIVETPDSKWKKSINVLLKQQS